MRVAYPTFFLLDNYNLVLNNSVIQKFLVFTLFLFWNQLSAQQLHLPLKHIDITGGYSGNHVLCIHKDQSGFMWLGSDNGLCRYDGQKLLNIENMEGVHGKLADGYINDLAEDSAGNIWVQTNSALHRFNTRTGELEKFATINCSGSEEYVPLNQINVAYDGTMWSVCRKQKILRQVINKDNLSTELKMIYSNSDTLLNKILSNSEDVYIVGMTEARILKKNKTGILSTDFDHAELLQADAKIFCVENLSVSSDKKFVAIQAGAQHVIIYDNKKQTMRLVKSNYGSDWLEIMEMEFDASNNCWIGLRKEMPKFIVVARISATDGKVTVQDRSLMDWDESGLRCFLADEQGLFWLGTDRGLLKLHVTSTAFKTYLHRSFANSNDYFYSTRGMFEVNDSTLLVSTYKGSYRVNLLTSSEQKIKAAPMQVVYKFCRMPNGEIVGLENSQGVLKYTAVMNSLQSFSAHNSTLRCAAFDNDGNLMLGGNGTLYKINTGGKKILDLSEKLKDASICNSVVKDLVKRDDTSLYVATSTGVYWLNTNTYNITSLQNFWNRNKTSAPDVNQIYLQDKDNLWLATTTGLKHLNLVTKKLEVYAEKNGLSNSNTVSILPDEAGNLWLGTFNGLSCFLKTQKKFVNFFVQDGIPHNEFNYVASLQLKNGNLVFGTLNGVVCFNPKEVLASITRQSFSLTVSKLSLYDNKTKTYNATETGLNELTKIELNPFSRFFELEVALLNYANPEKHKFSFYLQNFDDNWIDNGSKRTIRYTNLNSGTYQLHIKALDDRGEWSKELIIPVVVSEVFYKESWFWILCILMFSLLGYLIYAYRMKQIKKMYEMRMSIAADLHDEVGSMLTGIAFQAELAQHVSGGEQLSALKKITWSLQDSIAKMRDVIWTVNAGNDKVGKLMNHFENHLYETLSPLGVRTQFETKGINVENEIDAFTRQHLFLIFKEAINNIIKHSNATEVKVTIENSAEGLLVEIKDNGTVTLTKFASGGNGLKNMQLRAKRIGAQIETSFDNGGRVILKRMESL